MIVVTPPTGTIGQQVLENVLDGGEPIRVFARDPSRLHSQTRERLEVVLESPAAAGDERDTKSRAALWRGRQCGLAPGAVGAGFGQCPNSRPGTAHPDHRGRV
jgi:uncharacterized protein YbjT (DUF2867 family)